MKEIIAFTGHRPGQLPFKEYDLNGPFTKWLKDRINKELDKLDVGLIISGLALGVDQLAALIAIERNIPILAAVPFEGQDKIWPQCSKDIYNSILNNPLVTKHVVCQGGYSGWKMLKRNEFMVDRAQKLIAIFNGSNSGGTRRCFDYAVKQNKPIIRINPNDYPGTT